MAKYCKVQPLNDDCIIKKENRFVKSWNIKKKKKKKEEVKGRTYLIDTVCLQEMELGN